MKNAFRLFIGFIIASSLSSCGYNSMVEKREAVNGAWGNVESAYQRRADLIPNLVNTVKGAANFEQTTLTAVVEARAKATSIQLTADDLTEENLQKFQEAQDGLKGALKSLMMVTENYPELKATASFQELQAQLEGTENRINTERNLFNEAVKDYNAYIASFPQLMFAKMFGFTPKAYFKAAAGTEKAPEVKF
ncbi:MAG: LemA family protein [Bacteroidetes bacterium]|nr:LemA family protein [Bacteroidota bacterium]MBK8657968.1 LemA family protein [Bacteroidota bacterium]